MSELSEAQRHLLHDVLARRAPDLLRAAAPAGVVALTERERRAVEDAIADEFIASGLASDDEPNARGLKLETLLDAVLRLFRTAPPLPDR